MGVKLPTEDGWRRLPSAPSFVSAVNGVYFPADRPQVSAPGTSPPDAGKSPYRAISRFVARQPIFTRDEQVFGYELFFRDGVENCFANPDPEAAFRMTLDSSMLLGLHVLVGTRRAFINCTYDVLLKDYITLLPARKP
jgi:hypothetical protein